MPRASGPKPRGGFEGRSKGGRNAQGGGSSKKGDAGVTGREVTVSKAMSYLLRHGAEKEGVKIDEGGWVRVEDLLSWQRIASQKVTFPELQHIVATNSKQRFTLLYAPPTSSTPTSSKANDTLSTTSPTKEQPPTITESESPSTTALTSSQTPTPNSSTSTAPSTQPPINPPPPSTNPSDYLIRASQGHSLPQISSSLLLHPLPLSSILSHGPQHVVHGTYAKAWKSILKTGGISRMGRGHVHFSVGEPKPGGGSSVDSSKDGGSNGLKGGTGSEVEEKVDVLMKGISHLTLADDDTTRGDSEKAIPAPPSNTAIPPPTIISGMRKDCTHLIWVNITLSIQQGGLEWWRSENGVILTEGDEHGIVPSDFIERVEERRSGEVIWRGKGGGKEGGIGEGRA